MASWPRLALTLLVSAGCCFALPAESAVSGDAAMRVTFTTGTPNSSTGLHVDIRFGNPVGSSHKPPQLTGATIRLPAGTVIQTSARPQCTAPDAALQVAGTRACPASSQVGSGSLDAETGFGAPVDPLVGNDSVFNGENELIEVITAPGTPAPAAGVDHLTIQGSTLTAHPPSVPGGPPDNHTDIRRIAFTVPAHGHGTSTYIRTPATCPADGQWRTTATFEFSDGSSDVVVTTTPCR